MDLKHIIPQQRRRVQGPAFDIQYSVDRSNVPRVGPTPTFTRASSGTFVNENRRIVGKTTSTTSLNPASVPVGGVAVFAVPSGSVVGWLDNSVVSVMVDSDGNDQIDAQAHVTGTLLHKTDTAITLLVTSKAGTATVSSWFVSYRGQRITHDPVTGRCLGTLIEEGRTNLLSRSDGFNDTGVWGRANVSITQDGNISTPTNTAAFKIVENATTGSKYINRVSLTSVSTGITYTVSCFAKAAERTFLLLTGDTSTGAMPTACFDLANGSVSAVQAGGTASIQSFGSGWYRCIVSSTSTSTSVRFGIGMRLNSGTTFASYTGDGVSGLYIFGAQFEAGLNATSYIPTTAVAAARAQDLHTITGANFSYMYNQSSGTVFCSHTVSSFKSGHGIYGFQAPSRSDANITANLGNSTTLNLQILSSPFANQALFSNTVSASGQTKSALAFRTDDFAASVNGSISTDSSGVLNPIMDRFVIGATGNSAGPQVGNNIFSSIRLYRDRLPNAQLQTLTTTATETIVYNGVAIWYNGEGLIETS
jgi:hypothetical protein